MTNVPNTVQLRTYQSCPQVAFIGIVRPVHRDAGHDSAYLLHTVACQTMRAAVKISMKVLVVRTGLCISRRDPVASMLARKYEHLLREKHLGVSL